LKKVEEQISQQEALKAALMDEMTKPEIFSNPEKLKDVQSNFNKVNSELADANKKWEEVATSIDQLTSP